MGEGQQNICFAICSCLLIHAWNSAVPGMVHSYIICKVLTKKKKKKSVFIEFFKKKKKVLFHLSWEFIIILYNREVILSYQSYWKESCDITSIISCYCISTDFISPPYELLVEINWITAATQAVARNWLNQSLHQSILKWQEISDVHVSLTNKLSLYVKVMQ